MDALSLALTSLLHVSAAAKLATAARIARVGLGHQYPFFVAGMSVSGACTASMLCAWWIGGPTAYNASWRILTPFSLMATYAVAAEAIWVTARHFPRPRQLAAFVASVCLIVSLVGVLPASLAIPGDLPRRHWKSVLLAVIVASRALIAAGNAPLRVNAKLHGTGISMALAASVAGDVILGWPALAAQAIGRGLPMLGGLAACRWWWQMRPAGEEYTPRPGPTLDDLEAQTQRIERAIAARAKGAGQ